MVLFGTGVLAQASIAASPQQGLIRVLRPKHNGGSCRELFYYLWLVSILLLTTSCASLIDRMGGMKHKPAVPPYKQNEQVRFEVAEKFIAQKIKKLNPKGDARSLSRLIVTTSKKESIDPLMLASIVKHESTFKRTVRSNRGATGLMQIMPSTGKYIASKVGLEWRGQQNLYHPEYNLRLGIRYLQYLKRRFMGDMRLALVAYNWGPTNLERSMRYRTPLNRSAVNYASNIITLHSEWDREVKLLTRSRQAV